LLHGSVVNVAGLGTASMSDSSTGLNPVIDEPSKPFPPANASSSSEELIEKLLSWPRTSVKQSLMKRMFRSSTSAMTSSAVGGLLAVWSGPLIGRAPSSGRPDPR